jgi:hypothetical protein
MPDSLVRNPKGALVIISGITLLHKEGKTNLKALAHNISGGKTGPNTV